MARVYHPLLSIPPQKVAEVSSTSALLSTSTIDKVFANYSIPSHPISTNGKVSQPLPSYPITTMGIGFFNLCCSIYFIY
jgi:hypothetical protein